MMRSFLIALPSLVANHSLSRPSSFHSLVHPPSSPNTDAIVNKVGHDHIGLLADGIFNASVRCKNLPQDFQFNNLELAWQGDAERIELGSTVRIAVEGVDVHHGQFSVRGIFEKVVSGPAESGHNFVQEEVEIPSFVPTSKHMKFDSDSEDDNDAKTETTVDKKEEDSDDDSEEAVSKPVENGSAEFKVEIKDMVVEDSDNDEDKVEKKKKKKAKRARDSDASDAKKAKKEKKKKTKKVKVDDD